MAKEPRKSSRDCFQRVLPGASWVLSMIFLGALHSSGKFSSRFSLRGRGAFVTGLAFGHRMCARKLDVQISVTNAISVKSFCQSMAICGSPAIPRGAR